MKICTLLKVTENNDDVDVQMGKTKFQLICMSTVPDDHKFGVIVTENGKFLHLEGKVESVAIKSK